MEAETLPKRMLQSHAKWIQMEESVTNFTNANRIAIAQAIGSKSGSIYPVNLFICQSIYLSICLSVYTGKGALHLDSPNALGGRRCALVFVST